MMSQFVLTLSLESIVVQICSVSFKNSVLRIFSRHFIVEEVMAIGLHSYKEVGVEFWGTGITVGVSISEELCIYLLKAWKMQRKMPHRSVAQ